MWSTQMPIKRRHKKLGELAEELGVSKARLATIAGEVGAPKIRNSYEFRQGDIIKVRFRLRYSYTSKVRSRCKNYND
jgi:hypothetical protein